MRNTSRILFTLLCSLTLVAGMSLLTACEESTVSPGGETNLTACASCSDCADCGCSCDKACADCGCPCEGRAPAEECSRSNAEACDKDKPDARECSRSGAEGCDKDKPDANECAGTCGGR